MKVAKCLIFLFLLLGMAPGMAAVVFNVGAEDQLPLQDTRGSYVIIISKTTAADSDWAEVAETLRKPYEADLVIVPDGKITAALPTLRRLRPRAVAFVARPEEAGRSMVVAIHRMLRRLDEDPYGDALWGILTGYDAADAIRLVKRKKPLVIKSGFSSMGPGLAKHLGSGFASSETDAHKFWRIDKTGVHEEKVNPDPTEAMVQAFSQTPPNLMQTSGHATEKDWQIGYNVRAGQFRCDKGQLYALGVDGQRRNIVSAGPTVYMPMGNCLIGHISGRDCMVTAWLHTGGVCQMYGYTVVTFFGYMGWGVNTYFGDGGMSLSQAFYANCQALLNQLHTRFPHQASIEFDTYGHRDINSVANRFAIRQKDLLGMLWDRDTVAFYGDPSWVARMPARARSWSAVLTRDKENKDDNYHYKLVIKAQGNGKWPNRPLVLPLPERLDEITAVASPMDIDPVVTDDFILLPVTGKHADDTQIEVTFRAGLRKEIRTMAKHDPVNLANLTEEDLQLLSTCARDDSEELRDALLLAGEHRAGLLTALRSVPKEQCGNMAFLIINMPEPDLQSLDPAWLVEHVSVATSAWRSAPWHEQISEALFRDYILPYASVDESRENWMPAMRKRCLPMVEGCKTPGEAALALNKKLYKATDVKYHGTKRPKPNQSPSESIEAGYASCTGLSIMLVDACRSVGVPARLVGVAAWTGKPGNHTWVEVWDNGEWFPVGASESWKLGDVWFRDAAAKASDQHYLTRIYAARWSRTGLSFPLIWNLGYRHVPALNVTQAYKNTRDEQTQKSKDEQTAR